MPTETYVPGSGPAEPPEQPANGPERPKAAFSAVGEGKGPAAVPLRYVPPAEPEKPPDVVEVMLRREAWVMVNGHKLRLVEPPFRFYVNMLKTLVGRGDTGLLTRLGTALKAVAAKGGQAEVESALLESLIGESADFVCDFLARLILRSNVPDDTLAVFRELKINSVPEGAKLTAESLTGTVAEALADNVPAAGMAGLVSAALYVCDVATLRGFFGAAAAQFRRRTKT